MKPSTAQHTRQATQEVDTLIIGAGISGLGCGLALREAGRDCTILASAPGGRICYSSQSVPYGAFFVGSDYLETLPWVHLGEKIRPHRFRYIGARGSYGFHSICAHPKQLLRTSALLTRFHLRVQAWHKRVQTQNLSLEAALQRDAELTQLYRCSALAYCQDQDIYPLAKKFIFPTLRAILFSEEAALSAFEFLFWARYMLLPSYRFHFDASALVSATKQRFQSAKVHQIEARLDGRFDVYTEAQSFRCQTLVCALPPHQLKPIAPFLFPMANANPPASSITHHVQGQLSREATKALKRTPYLFFQEQASQPWQGLYGLARIATDEYLLQTSPEKDPIPHLFDSSKVIHKEHWEPAFAVVGGDFIEMAPRPGLHLCGDYNFNGLEHAYLSGRHTASRILTTKPLG